MLVGITHSVVCWDHWDLILWSLRALLQKMNIFSGIPFNNFRSSNVALCVVGWPVVASGSCLSCAISNTNISLFLTQFLPDQHIKSPDPD
ncbi:hypothetical protein MPTK1_1g10140 [Marchantia polymorpha subsp. ruderalis]|uniref:Uncharacterized protein n=2 Tax=Marchantia polymorpha TaxID=3197 RepID=A0AAF6ANI8_MARPO|nr:hypothetical protein MARPO_0014s0212 [Marchantia polymorpha]BBM98008.1 hypothetical protein Mp_1g10140 [Marchantia polymorpha subsp. ruderalis]|eukprot:PTQ45718.1 hypothetical protein MARPO_0014s0212 [Marchantia polymorpha]